MPEINIIMLKLLLTLLIILLGFINQSLSLFGKLQNLNALDSHLLTSKFFKQFGVISEKYK